MVVKRKCNLFLKYELARFECLDFLDIDVDFDYLPILPLRKAN